MDLWCHAPGCSSHTHPAALIQSAGWGGEDVYHAAELPASQFVCHSLRPETHWERKAWGREHCIFLSIPLFSLVFPSSPLTFIFLVVACPLRAKGLLHSVCMYVCSRLHLAGGFSSVHPHPPKLQSWGLSGTFSHMHKHAHPEKHTHTHKEWCNYPVLSCNPSGVVSVSTAAYLTPSANTWIHFSRCPCTKTFSNLIVVGLCGYLCALQCK